VSYVLISVIYNLVYVAYILRGIFKISSVIERDMWKAWTDLKRTYRCWKI